MSELEHSQENGRKLEHIIQLLEGNGVDAPGFFSRLAAIERILYGKDSAGGLVQQVQEVRKWKAWFQAALSAIGGGVLAVVVPWIAKHL